MTVGYDWRAAGGELRTNSVVSAQLRNELVGSSKGLNKRINTVKSARLAQHAVAIGKPAGNLVNNL